MGQESPRGHGFHAVRMRAIAWSASGLAGLALAGCAATPPAEDPVQVKLNDLDARLARIERVVSNQSLLQLSNELDALRSDVRSMHNDIDQLVHNMDISRKQQRDLYADLDQRLKRLEGRNAPAGGEVSAAGAPPAGPSGEASNLPVPDGSDKANYQAAFALLKDSQYDRAIAAFQQFLQSFPDSALADNAQYWLGKPITSINRFRRHCPPSNEWSRSTRNRASFPTRCSRSVIASTNLSNGRRRKTRCRRWPRHIRMRPQDTWRSSVWRRWRPKSIDRKRQPRRRSGIERCRNARGIAEGRAAARQ